MPIAPVIGAAVIGAGASLAASSKASKAQKQAAQMQQQTEQQNLAFQQSLFDQQRADNAPWRDAGIGALGQLQAMTQPGFNTSDIANDPGYQFRMEQGRRAIDASAAARGTLNSGATLKSLTRYGQGVASDEFGQRFNRLASLAGIGQTANSANQNASQQFGAQASNAYGRIGEGYANLGNARASSYANTGAALGGLANNVGQYFTLRSIMQPQQAALPLTGAQLNLNSIGSLGTSPVFQPINFAGRG